MGKINYSFDQIQTGLIAFVGNLELKLQELIPDMPVYIQQSGDNSYFFDSKFNKTENQEIIQKVPRFVLNIGEISIKTEEKSNRYNHFTYVLNDKVYVCECRRLPLNIVIDTNFVSSNIIKMLENFEILATIISNPNVFTYDWLGSTFESSYEMSMINNELPTTDVGGTSRNTNQKTSLDLQLHIIVPRIASIKLLSDAVMNVTEFGMNSGNFTNAE